MVWTCGGDVASSTDLASRHDHALPRIDSREKVCKKLVVQFSRCSDQEDNGKGGGASFACSRSKSELSAGPVVKESTTIAA